MFGKPTLVLVCAGLLMGCHKKAAPVESAPAPAPAETSTATPETTPAPYQSFPVASQPPKALPPPPPTVAARAENYVRENVPGTPDAFLSAELRNFVQLKHRLPDSFSEFATVRLDSIPRPPEGKKWVIDTATLQVKSVPAK